MADDTRASTKPDQVDGEVSTELSSNGMSLPLEGAGLAALVSVVVRTVR